MNSRMALGMLMLGVAPSLVSAHVATTNLPDSIVLSSGKRIECRVLLETESRVVYRQRSGVLEQPRAEVREVRSVERSLRALLARFDTIQRGDAHALTALASDAKRAGLENEARWMAMRAVAANPACGAAWALIDGDASRPARSRGGAQRSLDDLRMRTGKWRGWLEIPTAHFDLRTDGACSSALDVAVDLERTYYAYYDLMAPLELFVFDARPSIVIFSDAAEYPAPPTRGAPAWYDVIGNTLYVNGARSDDPTAIVAELVEALMLNAFRRTLGPVGGIEPWAREGLASVFAVAVRARPGSVRFEFEAPHRPYFRSHERDPDPLGLEQVLRSGFLSFDSGPDCRRFTIQSYTLTHFLLFGGGGTFRGRFFEFLRRAYLGQGSTSTFLETMRESEREVEERWREYVRELAAE